MRIAVICDPDFDDTKQLDEVLRGVTKNCDPKKSMILCRSQDTLIEPWAMKHWFTVQKYYPGESLKDMISRVIGLVCFFGGGDEESEIIDLAKKAKIKLKVVLV